MMQQPTSEPMQHPCRCETCDHYTHPHTWSKLKDCELVRGKLNLIPIGEEQIISIVGCASHSANTVAQARQRIDELIVERERWMNNFLCEQQRVVDVMEFIKHHDDEVCGAYGLWEMNSEECMSFDGNCTLCKVNKAIALLNNGVEPKC